MKSLSKTDLEILSELDKKIQYYTGIIEDLKDGSSLKFTIARWYTPNDRSIDEDGITPDEEVELTAEDFSEDKDPQMDRALTRHRSPLEHGRCRQTEDRFC